MFELRGRGLMGAVTALTSVGFLLIGFDNGLMGGLGIFIFNGLKHIGCSNALQLAEMPSTTPLTHLMRLWLVS
jgi:hypothetical protein